MPLRNTLAVLLLVHGIAHLAGFTAAHKAAVFRLVWLALAAGWAATAAGVWFRSPHWLVAIQTLAAVSALCCVLEGPEARLGILVNVAVAGLAYAAIRYDSAPGLAIRDPALERLWESAPTYTESPPGDPAAQRFLAYTLAPGTRHAGAVRLRMHGEIRLGGWRPFRAEQVITRDGQFVWAATVSLFGLPIRGSDSLLNGQGEMRWKLLDLISAARETGPETSRSAAGRLHGEQAVWLPSVLLRPDVTFTAGGTEQLTIRVPGPIQTTTLDLTLSADGEPRRVRFRRFGNPDGQGYRESEFAVSLADARTFSGYRIPTSVRAGWGEGEHAEFFRATIESAAYK